jgi:predicted nucleic acid-binding protein
MEIVVDTNVFYDALVEERLDAETVLRDEHHGLYTFVMSDKMREELLGVFGRVWSDLPNQFECTKKLVRLFHRARWCNPQEKVHHSPDEADNEFIACAIEAGVEYIVTSNVKHFREVERQQVANCRGQLIRIATPKQMNNLALQSGLKSRQCFQGGAARRSPARAGR